MNTQNIFWTKQGKVSKEYLKMDLGKKSFAGSHKNS